MLLFNVTVKVDIDIANGWKQWLLSEHGPEVVATGCFTQFKLFQLLEPTEAANDGISKTFVVQYTCLQDSLYRQYINDFAPIMRQKGFEKFGEKFFAFRTLMTQEF